MEQVAIEKILCKELKLKKVSLSIPPDPKMGDLSFACFVVKGDPVDKARYLAKHLKLPKGISHVKNIGPYLNFFFDKSSLSFSKILEVSFTAT